MKDFKTGSFTALMLLMMMFLAFTCLTPLHASAAEPLPPTAEKDSKVLNPDYQIGPEDVLEISVWKNADLSKIVNVRPDGKISLPLIGEIHAAGLTPNQLRDAIMQKLKEYQEISIVSVAVQSVNSYKVYILGEVRVPGSYVLKARTTVLQALSLAGGFSEFASKNKLVLIRKRPDGSDEKLQIKFSDLVYNEQSHANAILMPGDTIFVP